MTPLKKTLLLFMLILPFYSTAQPFWRDMATQHASVKSGGSLKTTVCLLPLGKIDDQFIPAIRRTIFHVYGFDTQVLAPTQFPKEAWFAPRNRNKASTTIAWMKQNFKHLSAEKNCHYMMALTSQDISTKMPHAEDWGVMGLAYLKGQVAITSNFRMKKNANALLLTQRYSKVVNHEIGHMLGIPHLPEKSCLMSDAEGTVKSVDASNGLHCQSSIDYLKQRGFNLPKQVPIDWNNITKIE